MASSQHASVIRSLKRRSALLWRILRSRFLLRKSVANQPLPYAPPKTPTCNSTTLDDQRTRHPSQSELKLTLNMCVDTFVLNYNSTEYNVAAQNLLIVTIFLHPVPHMNMILPPTTPLHLPVPPTLNQGLSQG